MEERLRTLSEAECYARCYGWRWTDDSVKVIHSAGSSGARSSGAGSSGEPDLRLEPSESGERLRRLLELRLDAREPEAA